MIVRQPRPMRRGLGDVCSDGPGTPFSWQRLKYTASMCNSVYNNNPLPAPPAPAVTLTSSASDPGAVFAGTDQTGAPVYAVPETAQESQTAIADKLQNFFSGLDTQVNPAPDPNAFPWSTVLAVGGAVVGALLLLNVTGGRRR